MIRPEKHVTITPAEQRIVCRLNRIHDKAHDAEGSDELDDWAFVYGFFVGAGIPPKRAQMFARLYVYDGWSRDPIFAKPSR